MFVQVVYEYDCHYLLKTVKITYIEEISMKYEQKKYDDIWKYENHLMFWRKRFIYNTKKIK